jgi:hypothetical protein
MAKIQKYTPKKPYKAVTLFMQVGGRVHPEHIKMIKNLRDVHGMNISKIIRNSIEFYYNYKNDILPRL